jgi:hypothetical protein
MLQARRSPVRVPDEVDFFNLPNPSGRTMALRSTWPLTNMSIRNFPGGKKRPARRAEPCRHLWAECLKMWESQPLTTLRSSTAPTGIALPYLYPTIHFQPTRSFARPFFPCWEIKAVCTPCGCWGCSLRPYAPAYKSADTFWPLSFTVSAWERVYATNLLRLQREHS